MISVFASSLPTDRREACESTPLLRPEPVEGPVAWF